MKWTSSSRLPAAALLLAALGGVQCAGAAQPLPADVERALTRAAKNRPQLEDALERVPPAQRDGMLFLIANMPPDDLASLRADFLVAHVTNASHGGPTFAPGSCPSFATARRRRRPLRA